MKEYEFAEFHALSLWIFCFHCKDMIFKFNLPKKEKRSFNGLWMVGLHGLRFYKYNYINSFLEHDFELKFMIKFFFSFSKEYYDFCLAIFVYKDVFHFCSLL